jgi:hypothetical protein
MFKVLLIFKSVEAFAAQRGSAAESQGPADLITVLGNVYYQVEG